MLNEAMLAQLWLHGSLMSTHQEPSHLQGTFFSPPHFPDWKTEAQGTLGCLMSVSGLELEASQEPGVGRSQKGRTLALYQGLRCPPYLKKTGGPHHVPVEALPEAFWYSQLRAQTLPWYPGTPVSVLKSPPTLLLPYPPLKDSISSTVTA